MPAYLHELFEAQVDSHPNEPAAVCGETRLSYRELNSRVNQLAYYLRTLGVGPEVTVGVRMPRGINMPVAVLATLKAGGIYVPMETQWPPSRAESILSDAQCRVVVVETVGDNPSPNSQIHVVSFEEPMAWADHPATNPTPIGSPRSDRAAYVLYTSGSTGRPKGVLVEHRQVLNYLEGVRRRAEWPERGTYAMLQPLSFDSSVTMFYSALCTGGCLHLISEKLALDAPSLGCYLLREGIDCLKIAPSHLAALLRYTDPRNLVPRHRLVLGGEECHWELVDTVHALTPSCVVFNHYGPTESTVGAVMHRLEPRQSTASKLPTVPIGRALANTAAFVLDCNLQLAPKGVAGELYLAGASLARAYVRCPGLTAERFVANPYGASGSRMYRTGDLARKRHDSLLEYLGRADLQLKVHGFRIEPAEVEAALRGISGVAQAIVVNRLDAAGQARLAAYVVGAERAVLDSDSLRQELSFVLPDYLVPSAIIPMSELPLTPQGKIDRSALPAPELPRETYHPPGTDEERVLCGLYEEVLSIARVGLDDSFFELGGDSIAAIRLVNRARNQALSITARDVFQHPAVRDLAQVAKPLSAETFDCSDRPIGPMPLTPIICRFLESPVSATQFAQSALVNVPPSLGKAVLDQGLRFLLEHHDGLRLRLERTAGEVRLSIPGEIPSTASLLMRVDTSGMEDEVLPSCIVEHAHQAIKRLDPEQGVGVQVVWFDSGRERMGRLFLAFHHLVVDGVSWHILLPDLRRACEAAAAGHQLEVARKVTSYRRWAELVNVDAATDARAAELPIWTNILRPPVMTLTDESPNVRELGGHFVVDIPGDITKQLLAKVLPRFHARIDDVLLTALAVAVARWKLHQGRRDYEALLIDLENHGRDERWPGADISRTVGWFTSIYPVRLELDAISCEAWSSNGALVQALKAAKEQLRQVPGGGLGFGTLRYLNKKTRPVLAALPAPEIKLNYFGRFGAAERGPWSPAHEAHALPAELDRQTPLTNRVEINVVTIEGPTGPRLRATWYWAAVPSLEAAVRRIAPDWGDVLTKLAEHAADSRAGGRTPSDFPLVALSQTEIDAIETSS